MWNFDKLCYCWQREPLERQIFSLTVWCAPVTAAVLFHADKCRLSFDPLWRSILTDWAAIMSSLAVRAARSFCFTHHSCEKEPDCLSQWQNVQVRGYFRSNQLHLLQSLQKRSIMLWTCLNLFMSPSVRCGSPLLYPLFEESLCLTETSSCLQHLQRIFFCTLPLCRLSRMIRASFQAPSRPEYQNFMSSQLSLILAFTPGSLFCCPTPHPHP